MHTQLRGIGGNLRGCSCHKWHSTTSVEKARRHQSLHVALAIDNESVTKAASPSEGSSLPSPTDPVEVIAWGGRLPSRRRLLISSISATAIVLGGNLGGVTSRLLSSDGGALAARLRLDVLVPVAGFKRCVDYTNMFEFSYPADWLGDQTLANRAALRAEAQRGGIDPPALRSARQQQGRNVVEPVAAFGPPGSSGEENVSVVVAPIFEGFTLQSMGSPEKAGAWFLTTIAAEGSGRQAQLLGATQRLSADGTQLYYEMEYVLQGPGFNRHNISVYTARNNLLYTFNAQCPEVTWPRDSAQLQHAAASFKLM